MDRISILLPSYLVWLLFFLLLVEGLRWLGDVFGELVSRGGGGS